MRILLVSATVLEAAAVQTMFAPAQSGGDAERRHVAGGTFGNHDVDVLITGVGMVATAAWCSRVLAGRRYDVALNFGVCGSFDGALAPGAVVHVVSDRLAELGAEDGDAFIPIEELNLPGDYQFVNPAPPRNAALAALPAVRGITVNTVHGSAGSIAAVMQRCAPQVESMEGAAFMCACLMHEVAFAQVRAVSNMVEKRNRGAWKMADAIANLSVAAVRILEHL
jgi:futalosine hydrolase